MIVGPTNAEKVANAATMFGQGSKQHAEAQRRFAAHAKGVSNGPHNGAGGGGHGGGNPNHDDNGRFT